MAETISPVKLWTLIVLLLLSSSTLGIILKLMDMVEVDGQEFEHPFFQSLLMFVGESLCIFVYLFQKYRTVKEYGSVQASPGMVKAVEEGMKTDINPLMFAIPMFCDATASTLLLIGYINIPASIVQMMGGFVVLVVAIMSIIFLKKKQYRHHWLGILLIFIGIGMVAATALLNKGDSDTSKNPVLGIAMLIGSVIIQGCQYIVEEKLLGSYYLNPMKVVGWEGITGTILFAILLPILQFVPCNASMCSNGVVEDTRLAFSQIGKSPVLIIFICFHVVGIAGMNGLGMAVTKYASSASRVTLSQGKTVLVWLFFLIVPTFSNIKGEKFSFLQLGGFVVMVFGIIVYNEILILPFCGFADSTKANLQKREFRAKSLNYDEGTMEETEGDLATNDASDYAATSPKAYDYQRNYKRLKNQLGEKAGEGGGETYFKIENEED